MGYMSTKELYIRFVVCKERGDEAPCLRLLDYFRKFVLERLLFMRRQLEDCVRRVCLQYKLLWSTKSAALWFLQLYVAYRECVLNILVR
jgi:hypothetical protein